MNPILVFYHWKLVQQSDAAIRSNQLETKKSQNISVLEQAVMSV